MKKGSRWLPFFVEYFLLTVIDARRDFLRLDQWFEIADIILLTALDVSVMLTNTLVDQYSRWEAFSFRIFGLLSIDQAILYQRIEIELIGPSLYGRIGESVLLKYLWIFPVERIWNIILRMDLAREECAQLEQCDRAFHKDEAVDQTDSTASCLENSRVPELCLNRVLLVD